MFSLDQFDCNRNHIFLVLLFEHFLPVIMNQDSLKHSFEQKFSSYRRPHNKNLCLIHTCICFRSILHFSFISAQTRLPPIKGGSAPTGQKRKEKMSWRNPQNKNNDIGWGGGHKRVVH